MIRTLAEDCLIDKVIHGRFGLTQLDYGLNRAQSWQLYAADWVAGTFLILNERLNTGIWEEI